MKTIFAFLVILITITGNLFPQTVDVSLAVTDGAGGLQTLRFGLDASATDGMDIALGEAPLPPLPPTGVFDARFNLPNGTDASLMDYRLAPIPYINNLYTGQKIHEIQFQVGNGSRIEIRWNFHMAINIWIIGRLQDVILGTIIDVHMSDSGSYTVTNPSVFNKLKMTISYVNVLPVELTAFTAEVKTNTRNLSIEMRQIFYLI